VRAAMQTVQTENVVRLEASQMLNALGSEVTMVSRFRPQSSALRERSVVQS